MSRPEIELWLKSLNHEQNSVSCTMLSITASKHWLEKRGGAAALFCSFCGWGSPG